MLTEGVTVLVIVDLDSGSGSAVLAKAKAQGVATIDYDRLTLGGGADYYVSYDNVKVGQLQGQGLINCMNASGLIKKKPVIAELNGAPTDNNAKLFAQGYNGVLANIYKNGTAIKGPNQSVPQWDNQKALTIFQGMLTQTNNKINAVLAANDGLANSVISALKARKLPSLPVTGQDATAEGIQHILAGDQCMTVYKAVKAEADAAAKAAIALDSGQTPTTNGTTANKTKQTPSVLLTPVAVTKANINDTVIKDGFLTKDQICQGAFAKDCTAAGL
jgi:D-xylose transport system substrate-binding protein